MREFSSFLTENASIKSNPYTSNAKRNSKYYREKIDVW